MRGTTKGNIQTTKFRLKQASTQKDSFILSGFLESTSVRAGGVPHLMHLNKEHTDTLRTECRGNYILDTRVSIVQCCSSTLYSVSYFVQCTLFCTMFNLSVQCAAIMYSVLGSAAMYNLSFTAARELVKSSYY